MTLRNHLSAVLNVHLKTLQTSSFPSFLVPSLFLNHSICPPLRSLIQRLPIHIRRQIMAELSTLNLIQHLRPSTPPKKNTNTFINISPQSEHKMPTELEEVCSSLLDIKTCWLIFHSWSTSYPTATRKYDNLVRELCPSSRIPLISPQPWKISFRTRYRILLYSSRTNYCPSEI